LSFILFQLLVLPLWSPIQNGMSDSSMGAACSMQRQRSSWQEPNRSNRSRPVSRPLRYTTRVFRQAENCRRISGSEQVPRFKRAAHRTMATPLKLFSFFRATFMIDMLQGRRDGGSALPEQHLPSRRASRHSVVAAVRTVECNEHAIVGM
jgi:hypothetical protein